MLDQDSMTSAERVAMDERAARGVFGPLPTASYFLEQAASEQADRARTYDAPSGERSMAKTVAAFNAIHGTAITEVQGWQFMELLKMIRSAQGAYREDSYVDGCSYAALAGEAAAKAAKR